MTLPVIPRPPATADLRPRGRGISSCMNVLQQHYF
jgi:hypothetical protein